MNITKTKLFTGSIAVLLFAMLVGVFTSTHFLGAETSTTPENKTTLSQHFDTLTSFSATTSQATSTGYEIWGVKRVTAYFTRNDGNAASTATSTFSIEVSPDGTTWYDYNKLISNVTNTNSQDLTRVASVQIVGATSTTMVAVDLENDVFHSIRCIANFASTTIVSTDSNTCKFSVID